MAENSGIQWTNHTFNPWRGCVKVSPGCDACYAESASRRNPRVLGVWGAEGTRVLAAEAQWRLPAKWNDAARTAGLPARVFCASIADVFEDWTGQLQDSQERPLWTSLDRNYVERIVHGDRPHPACPPYLLEDARKGLWWTIEGTRNLRWLLLTKRPQNINRMLPQSPPLQRRIWLGTTVEDQQRAEERIPRLMATAPGMIRFLSCEPLLERVDLAPFLKTGLIHWVIVGGESSQGGARARPFDLSWAEEIVNDCRRFKVKCFVKQLGSKPIAEGLGLLNRKGDRHGGTLADWPEWLQVREVPES